MENKILQYIKDYNIIGIGESTHGQKNINILRFNLIKNLLEINKNKNLYVCIEDHYSICKYLNKYIHNKNINFIKYFNKLMPPIFKNIYFYKFLHWCKNHNNKNKNKIFLYGLDMRFNYYKSYTKLNKYVYKLHQKVSEDYTNRDYYMFQIFQYIYNSNKNKLNDTYFLIAHNGHINYFNIFEKPSIGTLLKNNHYNYCAIYSAFNYGKYTAFNPTLKKFQIITVNKKSSFIKSGFYILDKSTKNKKYYAYEGGFEGDTNKPYYYYYKRILNYKVTNGIIILSNELPLKIYYYKK